MRKTPISGLLFVVVFLFIGTTFTSCIRTNEKKQDTPYANAADTVELYTEQAEIKYAKGFRVTYHPSYKKLEVCDPSKPDKIIAKYLLVERGRPYSAASDEIVVEIPIMSLASVSTTHLPFITQLDQEKKLTGFSGLKYVKDKKILKQIAEGKVMEIGHETELNRENVIDLEPDILMVYPFEGMDYKSLQKAGIPVVYNPDYLELSPLGKAEYIKFFALFFNLEEKANRYFSFVEEEYNSLRNKVDQVKRRPLIFSGKSVEGEWHVPGGQSFAATMLKDAGAKYVWGEDDHNNVLNVDVETVLEKAIDSEWWVIVGANKGRYSLAQLGAEDPRYIEFKAFREGKVLFCNTYESDYFGKAVAEPQVVLRDLVHFIHPEIAKDHQPVYFYQLK